jgi:hypothetical protein
MLRVHTTGSYLLWRTKEHHMHQSLYSSEGEVPNSLVGIQRFTTTRCPPSVEKGDVAAIPGAGTPTSSCCRSYTASPGGGPQGRSSPLPPVVRRLYALAPSQHQQPLSCNTITGEKPLAPPPSSRSMPQRICCCRTAQVRFCLATFRSTGRKEEARRGLEVGG